MDSATFDLVERAVAVAGDGTAYADARVVWRRHRELNGRNGQLADFADSDSLGIGVRALVGSSWGFCRHQRSDRRGRRGSSPTGRRHRQGLRSGAGTQPHAAGARGGPPGPLGDAVVEDPFTMSLTEPVDLVTGITQRMHDLGIPVATAQLQFWDTRQWFMSTEGHRISQRLVESGGGINATAVGESETQVRSYPQSFGHYLAGGYEVVRGFDLPAVTPTGSRRRPRHCCPRLRARRGPWTWCWAATQVALQIHESVGHAIELDRILGWEAAFAGTSFLDLSQLGSLRYGSELMNITADATLPNALGSFGYDDEGTPAQAVDIVREGIWVGVLSGRDSAAEAGLSPGGMVRGDGFNRLPMVRMTNVGLIPGDSSLDAMIADTKHGIYMDVNRSWSIDDRRLNFQFGCEIGWEIVDGKLGRMVRNPSYTGITPRFWGSMDRLGGRDEWEPWGLPNCGKGQPMQAAHTGHPAVPARFHDVRVGVTA
jgi:TldD protein